MAHFFYINTEFETGGAGIWKKKLNLGTPNVRPYRTEPYRTKFGKLVRQSSVINITLFGRKGGKLTSGMRSAEIISV